MQLKRLMPLCFLLLAGCSVFEPLVYKITINQGNFIEQANIDKLRYNMDKSQVQYLLGTDMLMDSAHPNTWTYIYYTKPGHEDAIIKHLVIDFDDNGLLTKVSGDYKIPNLHAPISVVD